jgi:hypothetical protein
LVESNLNRIEEEDEEYAEEDEDIKTERSFFEAEAHYNEHEKRESRKSDAFQRFMSLRKNETKSNNDFVSQGH